MRALIVLPFLLLAGCGNQAPETLNGQAVDAPAPSPRTADALQPGQWALTTRVTSLSGGNVTPEMRAQATTRSASYDSCIPADEAGTPDANFFMGGSTNECNYRDHQMADGKLRATIACNVTPGAVTATLDGTYDATTLKADATVTTTGMGGADTTQTAKLEARRLGECRGVEAQTKG